jgi:predicted kinase
MNKANYTEQRFDYTAGRSDAPELIMMVGIAGSGKSTLAKRWVNEARGDLVRVNRDNLRAMLFVDVPWSGRLEEIARNIEREAVRIALIQGKNVVIDNTNCVRRTRYGWEEFAKQLRVRFRIVTMNTTLNECIERDAGRVGKEQVGREVIERQHKQLNEFHIKPQAEPVGFCRAVWERDTLRNGGFTRRLPDAPFVLCDVDGTLADCEGIRSPFDEDKVLLDSVRPVVVHWVRQLYKSFNIVIVSGRHDTCGNDTCEWLEGHDIPYDHILMRRGGDNRKDFIVKSEILDELLKVIKLEDIAFVLDDRPQVVRMWKSAGLTVYPVAGTTDHKPNCPGESLPKQKGAKRCVDCGALGDF